LLHLLPRGFHRIRHYGLLAASARKVSLARARDLLTVAPPPADEKPPEQRDTCSPCPCCGGQMVVVEIFARWCRTRAPPAASCSAEEVSPCPGTDQPTPAPQQPLSGDQPMSRLTSSVKPHRSPLASIAARRPAHRTPVPQRSASVDMPRQSPCRVLNQPKS